MVGIKFDECESSIGLHSDFDDIAVSLEEWDKVGLSRIRNKVPDVDRGVEFGCLSADGLVGLRWSGDVGWLRWDRGIGSADTLIRPEVLGWHRRHG